MKIIINTYQYSPSITGTDRMAHNFLLELQKIDQVNKYIVVCSTEPYNRSILSNGNFRTIAPIKLPFSLLQRIYNKLWRTFLPLRLKMAGADCYLSFHNMTLPKLKVAKKMIAFNLDLIPIVIPGYETIHHKSRDQLVKDYLQVVARADQFISISQFSKDELCKELSVDARKVEVIHLAADPSFGAVTSKLSGELNPQGYILTMGGTEPRKNVKTVAEAYLKLPDHLRQQYPLVIMGGAWHGINLNTLKIDPNIICLGYVKDDELPALYKNAAAFVFASEYEGFGFTILEAMACGTPVITSTSSSLSEVADSAALLFEPHDINQLTEHLSKLLSDPAIKERLVKLGELRAEQFSWEVSARKLHDAILRDNSLEQSS